MATPRNIEVIANDISNIKDDIKEIKRQMEAQYVTKTEFDPIKKIVYGLVSLILITVAGAMLSLVLNK